MRNSSVRALRRAVVSLFTTVTCLAAVAPCVTQQCLQYCLLRLSHCVARALAAPVLLLCSRSITLKIQYAPRPDGGTDMSNSIAMTFNPAFAASSPRMSRLKRSHTIDGMNEALGGADECEGDAEATLLFRVGAPDVITYTFNGRGMAWIILSCAAILPWLARIPPIYLVIPGAMAPAAFMVCVLVDYFPERVAAWLRRDPHDSAAAESPARVDSLQQLPPPPASVTVTTIEVQPGAQPPGCCRRLRWIIRSDLKHDSSNVLSLAKLLGMDDDVADNRLNHWLPCVLVFGHSAIIACMAGVQIFQQSLTDCMSPPCDTLPACLGLSSGLALVLCCRPVEHACSSVVRFRF